MLTTLANTFMTATRMDGFGHAAPAAPAGRTDGGQATPSGRLAAILRRVAG